MRKDELTEQEIIENTEAFIENAKDIVNDKNNNLDMESRINIYTFQVTMEGLLNLYRNLKNIL